MHEALEIAGETEQFEAQYFIRPANLGWMEGSSTAHTVCDARVQSRIALR
jgi:hypothetical protein